VRRDRRRRCRIANPFAPNRVIEFPAEQVSGSPRSMLPADRDEGRTILRPYRLHGPPQRPVVTIAVPSCAPTRRGQADIVEEVVRIVGRRRQGSDDAVRNFGATAPRRKPVLTRSSFEALRAKRAHLPSRPRHGGSRNVVVISKPAAELYGGGQAEMALSNPIASTCPIKRKNKKKKCARACCLELVLGPFSQRPNRGFSDVSLLEVGPDLQGQSRTHL